MNKLCIVVFVAVLSACTHIDTGQVDYRVADAPRQSASASLCSVEASATCDPHRLSRVQRRYDPGTDFAPFTSPDVYSIEIEQGVIGNNILEGSILGRQMGS